MKTGRCKYDPENPEPKPCIDIDCPCFSYSEKVLYQRELHKKKPTGKRKGSKAVKYRRQKYKFERDKSLVAQDWKKFT